MTGSVPKKNPVMHNRIDHVSKITPGMNSHGLDIIAIPIHPSVTPVII